MEENMSNDLIARNLISLSSESQSFSYENSQRRFQLLCQTFPNATIRQVKRDGNCFLRAFLFSYFEVAIQMIPQEPSIISQIRQIVLEEGKTLLQATGFQSLVYEDFLQVLSDLLLLDCNANGGGQSLTFEKLLLVFNDLPSSNSIVIYFRFLISAYIRSRQEYFENFINWTEFGTFDEFCNSVESLDKESDQISIVALNELLGASCMIYVLDNSAITGEESEKITLLFQSQTPKVLAFGKNNHSINLLYRPGHYDIFYPQSNAY